VGGAGVEKKKINFAIGSGRRRSGTENIYI
jgi:hypothetical protein